MGQQITFHAPHGASDFLGLRHRGAAQEIVYDDGVARRMVWRVSSDACSDQRITEALQAAVLATRVLPSLHAELKKRAIAIERILG